MEREKKKVVGLSLAPCVIEQLDQIAAEKFGGNRSAVLSYAVESLLFGLPRGLDAIARLEEKIDRVAGQ